MLTKAILFSLLLLEISYCCHAQRKTLGSDRKNDSVEIARTGTFSIDQVLDMVLQAKNPESALVLLEQAKKMAVSQNDEKRLGLVFMSFATVYLKTNELVEGKRMIGKAQSIFKKYGYYKRLGDASLLLGEFYNNTDPKEIALKIENLEKATVYFVKSVNNKELANTYQQLATLQALLHNYAEALSMIQKAILIYRQLQAKEIDDSFMVKGHIFLSMGAYEKALGSFLSILTKKRKLPNGDASWSLYNQLAITCIGLGNNPMADIYFKRALTIAERTKELKAIMLVRANMMAFMVHNKEAARALQFINETENKYPLFRKNDNVLVNARRIDSYLSLHDTIHIVECAGSLTELSAYVGQKERAIAYKALIPFFILKGKKELAEKYLIFNDYFFQLNKASVDLAENYRIWAMLDSAKLDFSAAKLHRFRYVNLRDSLLKVTEGRELAALGISFNTASALGPPEEIDITPSIPPNKSDDSDVNLKKISLYAGVLLLLILLLIVVYRLLKSRRMAAFELMKKQAEIVEKNTSLQNMVNQKDILIEEKEWLMKEIHHRVKNNLQIVISLLNTQSAYLDDNKASEAIRESQQRMQSISLIHQKLYQSDSMDMVDMKDYISELVENLMSSFDLGKRILVQKKLDKIQLDVARAVPIGLIINEAVINAFKYAFPEHTEGKIKVSFLDRQEQGYSLTIADDGNGLPAGVDVDDCKSLGMNLMKGLSKQVKGNICIESKNGLIITLNFGQSTIEAV